MSDVDMSEYTIVPATEEHKDQIGEYARQEFTPNLSPEFHSDVIKRMRNAEFSADDRFRQWALVRRGNETGTAYSFAESNRRDGMAKNDQGEIRDINVYGITFVITPKEYRRKGYAHHLLRLLHYFLSPTAFPPSAFPSAWGAPPIIPPSVKIPPATISYLSSTASPTFYEQVSVGPDQGIDGKGPRPGWVSNRNSENSDLVYPLKKLDSKYIPTGWNRVWVYQRDLDGMAKELEKVVRAKLEETDVPLTTTVVRLRPTSPGIMNYVFMHVDSGGNWGRDRISEDTPVGARFYATRDPETDSPADHDPPYTADQPIILYIPNLLEKGRVQITFLNVPFPLRPLAMVAMVDSAPDCTDLRAWGLEADDPMVVRAVEAGGRFESKVDNQYMPNGVCWYGPEDEGVRFDGLEAWTWL